MEQSASINQPSQASDFVEGNIPIGKGHIKEGLAQYWQAQLVEEE
jgi:hypothetical protein